VHEAVPAAPIHHPSFALVSTPFFSHPPQQCDRIRTIALRYPQDLLFPSNPPSSLFASSRSFLQQIFEPVSLILEWVFGADVSTRAHVF